MELIPHRYMRPLLPLELQRIGTAMHSSGWKEGWYISHSGLYSAGSGPGRECSMLRPFLQLDDVPMSGVRRNSTTHVLFDMEDFMPQGWTHERTCQAHPHQQHAPEKERVRPRP